MAPIMASALVFGRDWMLMKRSIGTHLERNACIEVILPVVATAVVCLRLSLRKAIKSPLKTDDYLVLVSLLFIWGQWGTWYYTSENIVGQRISQIDVTKLEPFIKACFAMEFFYAQGLNVIKFAVLFFYLRALGTTKSARTQIFVLMGIVGAYTATRLFGTIFECVPFSYFWNRAQHGYCVPARPYLISFQALNWATELCILLYPIPTVLRLNLPLSRKLAVAGVFLIGGLTCAASAVRLYYIQKIFDGTATALLADDAVPKLQACNLVEMCLAAVAASLPAVRVPAARAARTGLARIRTRTSPRGSPASCVFPGAQPKKSSPHATTTATTEPPLSSIDLEVSVSTQRDSIHVSKEITIEEVSLGPRPLRFLFSDDDLSLQSSLPPVSPILEEEARIGDEARVGVYGAPIARISSSPT